MGAKASFITTCYVYFFLLLGCPWLDEFHSISTRVSSNLEKVFFSWSKLIRLGVYQTFASFQLLLAFPQKIPKIRSSFDTTWWISKIFHLWILATFSLILQAFRRAWVLIRHHLPPQRVVSPPHRKGRTFSSPGFGFRGIWMLLGNFHNDSGWFGWLNHAETWEVSNIPPQKKKEITLVSKSLDAGFARLNRSFFGLEVEGKSIEQSFRRINQPFPSDSDVSFSLLRFCLPSIIMVQWKMVCLQYIVSFHQWLIFHKKPWIHGRNGSLLIEIDWYFLQMFVCWSFHLRDGSSDICLSSRIIFQSRRSDEGCVFFVLV